MTSPEHPCAIITLLNPHLDDLATPVRWMDCLCDEEALTDMDFKRFLLQI